ncbi:hypothetical protein C8R43DRAFT_1154627 [Mycena crocata]|nr:hypothetical protein C8R43DRAFT_1154627 [Mycena crocata]
MWYILTRLLLNLWNVGSSPSLAISELEFSMNSGTNGLFPPFASPTYSDIPTFPPLSSSQPHPLSHLSDYRAATIQLISPDDDHAATSTLKFNLRRRHHPNSGGIPTPFPFPSTTTIVFVRRPQTSSPMKLPTRRSRNQIDFVGSFLTNLNGILLYNSVAFLGPASTTTMRSRQLLRSRMVESNTHLSMLQLFHLNLPSSMFWLQISRPEPCMKDPLSSPVSSRLESFSRLYTRPLGRFQSILSFFKGPTMKDPRNPEYQTLEIMSQRFNVRSSNKKPSTSFPPYQNKVFEFCNPPFSRLKFKSNIVPPQSICHRIQFSRDYTQVQTNRGPARRNYGQKAPVLLVKHALFDVVLLNSGSVDSSTLLLRSFKTYTFNLHAFNLQPGSAGLGISAHCNNVEYTTYRHPANGMKLHSRRAAAQRRRIRYVLPSRQQRKKPSETNAPLHLQFDAVVLSRTSRSRRAAAARSIPPHPANIFEGSKTKAPRGQRTSSPSRKDQAVFKRPSPMSCLTDATRSRAVHRCIVRSFSRYVLLVLVLPEIPAGGQRLPLNAKRRVMPPVCWIPLPARWIPHFPRSVGSPVARSRRHVVSFDVARCNVSRPARTRSFLAQSRRAAAARQSHHDGVIRASRCQLCVISSRRGRFRSPLTPRTQRTRRCHFRDSARVSGHTAVVFRRWGHLRASSAASKPLCFGIHETTRWRPSAAWTKPTRLDLHIQAQLWGCQPRLHRHVELRARTDSHARLGFRATDGDGCLALVFDRTGLRAPAPTVSSEGSTSAIQPPVWIGSAARKWGCVDGMERLAAEGMRWQWRRTLRRVALRLPGTRRVQAAVAEPSWSSHPTEWRAEWKLRPGGLVWVVALAAVDAAAHSAREAVCGFDGSVRIAGTWCVGTLADENRERDGGAIEGERRACGVGAGAGGGSCSLRASAGGRTRREACVRSRAGSKEAETWAGRGPRGARGERDALDDGEEKDEVVGKKEADLLSTDGG